MLLTRLDRVRGVVLRSVVATPWIGGVVRRRERRVALRLFCAIVLAFALAVGAPAATLAVSPLVLGVPHVASSLRYLVLRARLPRVWLATLGAGAALLAAFRVAEQYGGAPHAMARVEVAIGVALTAGAAIAASRGTPSGRRRLLFALPLLAVAGAFLVAHPVAARLGFVHVHNLGAVAVWTLLMQRRRAFAPLAALALAMAALLGGLVPPLQLRALGVDLETVGSWLLPGAAVGAAVPLVLAHVFTDSVHYAFWLGIIPEETLRAQGTPSFSMTWRLLLRDFGAVGLALVAAAGVILLVALAAFGLARARDAYFAVAGFHGYVEGVMLVFFLVRGRVDAEPIAALS